MENNRTKGYTEIVKITEAALNGDKDKALKYINDYILKYPESDLILPFNALLKGDNNPSGLGHHDIEDAALLNSKLNSVYESGQDDYYQGFIKGAKYMMELLYSIDEIKEMLSRKTITVSCFNNNGYEINLEKWIEFNKKDVVLQDFIEYTDDGDEYVEPTRYNENDQLKIRLYCSHSNCKQYIKGIEGYNGRFHAETGQIADLRNQTWLCDKHKN